MSTSRARNYGTVEGQAFPRVENNGISDTSDRKSGTGDRPKTQVQTTTRGAWHSFNFRNSVISLKVSETTIKDSASEKWDPDGSWG